MPKCQYCDSENLCFNGYNKTRDRHRVLCKDCRHEFSIPIDNADDLPDGEIIASNVFLAKQNLRFRDSNRIERKAFREYARVENSITEYNKALLEVFNKYSLETTTTKHEYSEDTNATAIVHFTDAHFNELINFPANKFNFDIASKRCKKFIAKVKQYLSPYNVHNVLFAMTGDVMNSDRLCDERMNMATNRAQATFLAVSIIEQMLLDLNEDYNVSVCYVSGNESRIQKDWGWSDILATDNYDTAVFNILKYIFRKSDSITFINGDPTELIVNVGGQNVLMLHGLTLGDKVERAVQQIIGKYANRGTIIDFVICGHLHSCRISDVFARGSSLSGANDYSDKGLELISRASQNLHIIFDKNNRDSIKIDLQDTNGVVGYPIQNELEAYNAKSSDRLRKNEVVFKIVI